MDPVPTSTISCPTGYIQLGLSCYKFVLLRRNWTDAMSYCSRRAGLLVSIQTEYEQRILKTFIDSSSGKIDSQANFQHQF